MNDTLKGKVALVTGASRGIGRAIAGRLARAGAAIAVNYSRNAAEAQKVVAEIKAVGGNAFAIQADVARVPDVMRLFDETIGYFGKLDVLVNNAGLMFTKPVSATTEEEFDRIFAVNVKGVFFACQQAATRLVAGGRIINLSSSTTARFMPITVLMLPPRAQWSSLRARSQRNWERTASRSTPFLPARRRRNYFWKAKPRSRSIFLENNLPSAGLVSHWKSPR